MVERSVLDWALLGLLDQGPQSGYDLRRTFATTPLVRFSDSPGAIYPALRRLERHGLIEAVAAQPAGGRGRRPLQLTAEGRRSLLSWLRRLPTRAEVERDVETLILRLAFMSQALPPSSLVRFLAAFEPLITDHRAALERFYAEAGPGMPLSGRLAFESGLEGVRAYEKWVKRALRRARRTPERSRR